MKEDGGLPLSCKIAFQIFGYIAENIYFCRVIALLKAHEGRGGHDTYTYRSVIVRFGFDSVESRKFNGKSKAKQRERRMGCIVSCPYCALTYSSRCSIGIYIHHRGAFSVARFDLPGNARALHCGTSKQNRLHVFICVCSVDNLSSPLRSRWQQKTTK